MIRNARDLSIDQKAAIESLLGRRVMENQAISVRTIDPPALSDDRRLEVLRRLEGLLRAGGCATTTGFSRGSRRHYGRGVTLDPSALSACSVRVLLDVHILVWAGAIFSKAALHGVLVK